MPAPTGRLPTLVFIARFVDAVVTEPLADMIAGRLRIAPTPAPRSGDARERKRPAAA